MAKERISASVDPDVKAYLQKDEVNASGLINQAIRESMNGRDESIEVLRIRRDRLVDEEESLESRLKSKRKQRERVEKQIEERTESMSSDIEEAREALSKTPKKVDNPAIKSWAEKIGITPEELINELEEDE